MKASPKSFFDEFWKLKIGKGNEEHDFEWKGELNESMTWHSRDGQRICTANMTHLRSLNGTAVYARVVQVGPSPWEALLDNNAGLPEFMVVKPTRGGLVKDNITLNFTIDYFYGYRDFDVIVSWAGLMTGYQVLGLSSRLKLTYLFYNSLCRLLSLPMRASGYKAYTDGAFKIAPGVVIPDGGNVAAAGIAVAVSVAVLLSTCCCFRRWKNRSKAKED